MNDTASAVTTASSVEEGMRIFVTVCFSVVIAFSLFGNILVCIAFKVNEQLRSVSNYFIFNLALSDLLTTIFVMPFDLDYIRRNSWQYGNIMCNFYTTMYLISAPASILNLLAVSIDRYRVISDPFVYERKTTPRRTLIVCACVWVYSTLMGLVPTMGWVDQEEMKKIPKNSTVCYFSAAIAYSIMISILHFVIPPLIMAILYFKIYKIANSHVRRIQRLESLSAAVKPSTQAEKKKQTLLTPPLDGQSPTTECNGHARSPQKKSMKRRFTYRYSVSAPPMLRRNVKAAKSLAVIVGTFFACWYPFTIASMVVNACGGYKGNCVLPGYISNCLLIIGYLNCALNPFLYAFHNAEFKKTYKKILRCHTW